MQPTDEQHAACPYCGEPKAAHEYVSPTSCVLNGTRPAAWSKRLDVDGPTGLEMESRVIRDQAAA